MRVLIVDDEPPARRRLRRLLEAASDVELVGEAGDGNQAAALIAELEPDAVFLDVQMPDLDGFGVLAALPPPWPAVVFVTAYDEYALRAFDVQAVDYLLKPFEETRFDEALERLRGLLAGQKLEQHREALSALLAEGLPSPRSAARIPVRRGETTHLLAVDEIEWASADGNSAWLHLHDGSRVRVRSSLRQLETRLPGRFVRAHRSSLVDCARVRRLHALFHGEFLLELESGAEVRVSRTFAPAVRTALGLADG